MTPLASSQTQGEPAGPATRRSRKFYTVPEAARLLEVSPSTIWRWIQADKLPAFRVGPRAIRIREEDLHTIVQPARARPKEVSTDMDKERMTVRSPTSEELDRRQTLLAQIIAKRKERVIAPVTTAELVRQVRDQETRSYGRGR